MYGLFSEIDNELKNGRLPKTEKIERLRQLQQQAMDEIDGLAAAESSDSVATAELGRDEMLAKLAALSALIENDLGAADSLLTELRTRKADASTASAIAEIATKIDIFDIDAAQTRIKTLRDHLSRTA